MSFETVALGDVCALGDGAHAKISRQDSGVPYLTSKNIKQGNLDLTRVDYISEADFNKHFSKSGNSVRSLEAGDILIGIIGTFGNVYLYKETDCFGISSSIGIIRPDRKRTHPEFLYYAITSENFKKTIEMYKGGSVQGYTNLPTLRKVEVSLPPLDKQVEIASILKSLDKKIELNNAINKNLEEIAQALFKRWFVDFEFPNESGEPYKSSGGEFEESELGLIPKGWRAGAATDVFNVQSGGTPKTGSAEYWDGEIPFFTPKDSGSSFYTINTEKKLTESGLTKCNSKLYKAGTVFITARGTVGKLSIAGRDMAMNQSCYALVATNGYTHKYIFLQTQLLINTIKKNASGAVFDAITASTFQSLKVALPNIELVEEFDKILEGFFNSILKNIIENQILSESRDTLLPKLMSGELQVPIDRKYSQDQMLDLPLAAESKAQYSTT
ncbi:restriction endonuclease subunit S [Paenibacillus apii]|uniref:restriction endonuclease subunit S n=1 Tax=Paenibacillus apii TaxID=1850370 RepID=UPI001F3D528B|nr:restriction endonuclease subunit S [Paenibacillus apii]